MKGRSINAIILSGVLLADSCSQGLYFSLVLQIDIRKGVHSMFVLYRYVGYVDGLGQAVWWRAATRLMQA